MIRRVLPQLSASGLWRGAYRYPESAVTAEGPPAEVSFTMCLKEYFWGGVNGTVTEDPAGGFPEQGRIEGRAGLREIQLFKRMPVLRFSKGDGTITFNEWVELTYGPAYVGEQLEHPVIHLRGRLSRWKGQMWGAWLMPAWALGAEADPDWRLDFPEQSGEWSAVRLSAL